MMSQSGSQSNIHTVEYTQKYPGMKCEELLLYTFENLEKLTIESRFNSEWEKELLKHNEVKQAVIFVESPPGAGKTHLMEEIMAKAQANGLISVRVDCSNDELVERAMESVLSGHFTHEADSMVFNLTYAPPCTLS